MDLAEGFSTYTTTSKNMKRNDNPAGELVFAANQESLDRPLTAAERREKMAQTEATLTLAKDSADILLNREGNLVQKLLVEESARATSAQVKDNLRRILVDGPKRFRDSLPLGAGSFLPPLPFEGQLSPFFGKTDEEIKAQQLAETLLSLVSQQQLDRIRGGNTNGASANGATPSNSPPGLTVLLEDWDPEQLALLSKELRESAPKYVPLFGLLGAKFASTLLQTASDNIDTALAKMDLDGHNTDGVTKATARGLSSVAKRSADLISDRVVNRTPTTSTDTPQR